MSKDKDWLIPHKALEDYIRNSDESDDSELSESELDKLKSLYDAATESTFKRIQELRSGGD